MSTALNSAVFTAVQCRVDWTALEGGAMAGETEDEECKQKGRLGEGRQSDIGENIKFNQINSQVHPKTNTSSSRPKNCSLSMANKLKGRLYNVHQHQDSPLHRSFPHHNNKCFYICLAVSVQPNANCKMWSQISFSLQAAPKSVGRLWLSDLVSSPLLFHPKPQIGSAAVRGLGSKLQRDNSSFQQLEAAESGNVCP